MSIIFLRYSIFYRYVRLSFVAHSIKFVAFSINLTISIYFKTSYVRLTSDNIGRVSLNWKMWDRKRMICGELSFSIRSSAIVFVFLNRSSVFFLFFDVFCRSCVYLGCFSPSFSAACPHHFPFPKRCRVFSPKAAFLIDLFRLFADCPRNISSIVLSVSHDR